MDCGATMTVGSATSAKWAIVERPWAVTRVSFDVTRRCSRFGSAAWRALGQMAFHVNVAKNATAVYVKSPENVKRVRNAVYWGIERRPYTSDASMVGGPRGDAQTMNFANP